MYYAKALSHSLWIKMLDQKWKGYLAQPESQKSLLEGALLFSQSLQENDPCLRDVEPLLKTITDRVKQLVAEMDNSSFALKTNPSNYTKKVRKILAFISQVMFDEMGFSCSTENEGWTLLNYQIEQVLHIFPQTYFKYCLSIA
jgi:hypothetical protein